MKGREENRGIRIGIPGADRKYPLVLDIFMITLVFFF